MSDHQQMASVSVLPTTVDACRNMLTYSRESSERLLGVFGQDAEIEEWAERSGFQIVGKARDNRVNGSLPAMKRPGLSAAIRAVEKGQVDGIVVRSFDRLARDFPTQDDALQLIWKAGGRFFTLDPAEEWKPDTPGDARWMSRQAYARMAEDERRALLARLQRARRRKIARGGYGGGGRIRRRYGVELVQIQGKWEYRPIPSEQAVIRRVCTACPPEKKGYAAMATALNEEGVPTVDGVPWSRKVVRDLALRGPDLPSVVPEDLTAIKPLEWVRESAARGA